MGLCDSITFSPDKKLREFLKEYDATNGRMYQGSVQSDTTLGGCRLPPLRPNYYGRKQSNNLRTKRNERRITQAYLAAKTGTTRRTVVAIENGRRAPSVYLAVAIAEALEVAVEEIFYLSPLTPVKPSKY